MPNKSIKGAPSGLDLHFAASPLRGDPLLRRYVKGVNS